MNSIILEIVKDYMDKEDIISTINGLTNKENVNDRNNIDEILNVLKQIDTAIFSEIETKINEYTNNKDNNDFNSNIKIMHNFYNNDEDDINIILNNKGNTENEKIQEIKVLYEKYNEEIKNNDYNNDEYNNYNIKNLYTGYKKTIKKVSKSNIYDIDLNKKSSKNKFNKFIKKYYNKETDDYNYKQLFIDLYNNGIPALDNQIKLLDYKNIVNNVVQNINKLDINNSKINDILNDEKVKKRKFFK